MRQAKRHGTPRMDALSAASALIALAALFSWLNHRFLRQPPSIALLLFSLGLSLAMVMLDKLGLDADGRLRHLFDAVELDRALLESMLSFLLFAGALQVDLTEMARRKWAIAFLASLSVIVSAVLAGQILWTIFSVLGHPLPLIWCLVFGALISPTDPIAVLGILKQANAERSLAGKMAGESLLNDGFGIVLFVLFLGIAISGEEASPARVTLLFVREVVGGALLGFVVGYVACRMLSTAESYQVELLITLAVAMGGYALARALHVSGPIGVVVAGVLIGHHGRRRARSAQLRERVDDFWELIDEILNAVLFVMIGLELLRLEFDRTYGWAAVLAVPAVLLARFASVGIAGLVPGLRRDFPPYVIAMMTWGGLRGGISIALALSVPSGTHRDAILMATYAVVLFSIVVQGLTLKRVLRWRRS